MYDRGIFGSPLLGIVSHNKSNRPVEGYALNDDNEYVSFSVS